MKLALAHDAPQFVVFVPIITRFPKRVNENAADKSAFCIFHIENLIFVIND